LKGVSSLERWEKVRAVQRMQDYIEQNLTEPITMHKLARAAGYSPFHAARIFKEITGKTPFVYIRMLRLSQAAVKLKEEDMKVVDVAFDFVFDSHEGFTRAFSKQFGMTPKQYSKNRPSLNLFMPADSCSYYHSLQKGEYTMSDNSTVNTVFVQVVDRPDRKIVLKRGIKATHYYEYCEEVGCDIWDILTGVKEAIYEPIGMWLPENMVKPGTSVYAQGVEVPSDFAGEVPEGFELIDLPPCKIMVFQGQPYDDEKFEQAISELWQTMKNFNPELYGFTWADEDGPRFQLEPIGYRGYIEARPVKQIRN